MRRIATRPRLVSSVVTGLLLSVAAAAEEKGTLTSELADEDIATIMIVGPIMLPPHDLSCGKGPHTVYNMVFAECAQEPNTYYDYKTDEGYPLCMNLFPEEWTDWPRCEGARPTTMLERHVRQMTGGDPVVRPYQDAEEVTE